jgi:hypothetical protein
MGQTDPNDGRFPFSVGCVCQSDGLVGWSSGLDVLLALRLRGGLVCPIGQLGWNALDEYCSNIAGVISLVLIGSGPFGREFLKYFTGIYYRRFQSGNLETAYTIRIPVRRLLFCLHQRQRVDFCGSACWKSPGKARH